MLLDQQNRPTHVNSAMNFTELLWYVCICNRYVCIESLRSSGNDRRKLNMLPNKQAIIATSHLYSAFTYTSHNCNYNTLRSHYIAHASVSIILMR